MYQYICIYIYNVYMCIHIYIYIYFYTYIGPAGPAREPDARPPAVSLKHPVTQ